MQLYRYIPIGRSLKRTQLSLQCWCRTGHWSPCATVVFTSKLKLMCSRFHFHYLGEHLWGFGHDVDVVHVGRVLLLHHAHSRLRNRLCWKDIPVVLWLVKVVETVVRLTVANRNVSTTWLKNPEKKAGLTQIEAWTQSVMFAKWIIWHGANWKISTET